MTSEVTQADRDEALPFIATDFRPGDTYSTGYYVRRGERDDHPLVQAFARHRLTAQSGEGRSGAGVDWTFIRECVETARSDYEGYHLGNKPGEPDLHQYDEALRWIDAALNARQSGEGERDSAIDEIQSLRKRVERLEEKLREAEDRLWHLAKNKNDPLLREIRVGLSPKVQGEE